MKQRRRVVFSVRFTVDEFDQLCRLAQDKPLSAYIREAALGAPKVEARIEAIAARGDRLEAARNWRGE